MSTRLQRKSNRWNSLLSSREVEATIPLAALPPTTRVVPIVVLAHEDEHPTAIILAILGLPTIAKALVVLAVPMILCSWAVALTTPHLPTKGKSTMSWLIHVPHVGMIDPLVRQVVL